MTLDEAIIHAKEKAEEQKVKAERYEGKGLTGASIECLTCAKEHEQLAEWLAQLQDIKKAFYEANDGDEFWHNVNEIFGEY